MSINIGIGIRPKNIGGGSAPIVYEPELVTYMTGLVTPLSTTQKALLNNFILSIKAGFSITNLSDAFDAIWVLAGETQESSLKNLVKNAHHCTLSPTAPIHVAFEGFTGNAISSYLMTNYNPVTQGVNYVLNNAGFGIYSRTARAASVNKIHGSRTDVTGYIQLYPFRAAGEARAYINQTGSADFVVADSLGMTSGFRYAANSRKGARNKTFSALNTTIVSTGMPNCNMALLAYYYTNGGSYAGFDDIQIAFAYITRGLSQTELNTLFDSIEYYLDYYGKGVV